MLRFPNPQSMIYLACLNVELALLKHLSLLDSNNYCEVIEIVSSLHRKPGYIYIWHDICLVCPTLYCIVYGLYLRHAVLWLQDVDLLQEALAYYRLMVVWLTGLVGGFRMPLPAQCPMEFASMPEHFVEDAMELLLFASRIPRALDGVNLVS